MRSQPADLSPRLAAVVEALPLRPGLRVLEIGCGPGAAARAVARRIGDGRVLAIDRSATAVAQARRGAAAEIAAAPSSRSIASRICRSSEVMAEARHQAPVDFLRAS